mmetsp:Transcript_21702/g.70119  ORF Transcript_21702/g.70119 Transcript_21702/m.70119 type:complete len:304 (+) Transcript_21702:249-1160(+)
MVRGAARVDGVLRELELERNGVRVVEVANALDPLHPFGNSRDVEAAAQHHAQQSDGSERLRLPQVVHHRCDEEPDRAADEAGEDDEEVEEDEGFGAEVRHEVDDRDEDERRHNLEREVGEALRNVVRGEAVEPRAALPQCDCALRAERKERAEQRQERHENDAEEEQAGGVEDGLLGLHVSGANIPPEEPGDEAHGDHLGEAPHVENVLLFRLERSFEEDEDLLRPRRWPRAPVTAAAAAAARLGRERSETHHRRLLLRLQRRRRRRRRRSRVRRCGRVRNNKVRDCGQARDGAVEAEATALL